MDLTAPKSIKPTPSNETIGIKENDNDNVSLIAGIFSGPMVVIIIIAIVVGTFIYRRKNREIKYLKRVHQANMERRVPGEHYEYNPEGEYYGDDRLTYYTVISIVFSLRVGTPPLALKLQGVSQVMRNMDRTGSIPTNGYMIPA